MIVLSDFGQNTGAVLPEQEADWRKVAGLIRRAGCHPLALVPAPPDRWPRWLAALMPVFSWDRGTTTARVHAALS
ncbi:hypothetical protein ACWD01_35695 [Streptomyces sp. NPDC002835]